MSNSIKVPKIGSLVRRGAVYPPISTFHLQDLGIKSERLIGVVSNYLSECPFDFYDVATIVEETMLECQPALLLVASDAWLQYWNTLHQSDEPFEGICNFWEGQGVSNETLAKIKEARPFRKRSVWQFTSKRTGNCLWDLSDLGRPAFSQMTNDGRSRVRFFHPIESFLRNDAEFLKFIASVCELLANGVTHGADEFIVTAHLMRTQTSIQPRMPAPEGLHQDGSDFIVSAVVIDKTNVTGGVSSIFYDKGKQIALQKCLSPGEGILQADMSMDLWHSVSPIKAVDPDKPAFRSILGLDVDVVG